MLKEEMERMKEEKMKTMYNVHSTTRTWKLSSEDLGSEEPHADAKISYQLDQIFQDHSHRNTKPRHIKMFCSPSTSYKV